MGSGSLLFVAGLRHLSFGAMTNGLHLDHLALASVHAWDNVVRYCYHLGARWLGGTDDYATSDEYDFYFAQVEMQDGTKLEILEPLPVVDVGIEFGGVHPDHLLQRIAEEIES